jgi:hypothetical protein
VTQARIILARPVPTQSGNLNFFQSGMRQRFFCFWVSASNPGLPDGVFLYQKIYILEETGVENFVYFMTLWYIL